MLRGVRPGQEVGVILQIAMVDWKMRHKAEAAEPYFERLRKQGKIKLFIAATEIRSGRLRLFRKVCDAVRYAHQTWLCIVI